MKSLRISFSIVLMLLAPLALAQTSAQKAFASLKTLDGMWAGKDPSGENVKVSYRSTSNGSALMSEIMGKEDMITMFHPDGDRLLMTHYCAAGNQPRMQGTASPDGKTITFNFIDGTNITAQQPGHMEKLVVTMLDPSHHTEQWSFKGADGKEMTEAFDLHRK